MPDLGDTPRPADFRYEKILIRGKPRHDETDAFRIRHPGMDVSKRAKIFAPFDALRGFRDALSAAEKSDR